LSFSIARLPVLQVAVAVTRNLGLFTAGGIDTS
jgi:hypothetical protein